MRINRSIFLAVATVLLCSANLHAQSNLRLCGLNVFGHVGNNSTVDSSQFSIPQLPQGAPVVRVATGGSHTLALRADGTVWAWGNNVHGQLGDGTHVRRLAPVQVLGINNALAIAAGHMHSVALLGDGTVRAWGFNNRGQLGDGTTTSRNTPVVMKNASGITAVATGLHSTILLRDDGAVYRCGAHGLQSASMVSPTLVPDLDQVTTISAGYMHFLARRSDGTVKAWGLNYSGQIGDGTTDYRSTPVTIPGLSNVAAIAAGGHHSIARLNDGTLLAWGNNNAGQLGNGSTVNALTPVPVADIDQVLRIGAGGSHTLALRAGGTLYAWGANLYGQLGDGTIQPRTLPAQVSLAAPASGLAGGGFTSAVVLGHSSSCPADVTFDNQVNVNDLLAVVNAWGPCPPTPAFCAADVAPFGGDGAVNVNDLLAVINGWGACP